jgi:hypothetical protein
MTAAEAGSAPAALERLSFALDPAEFSTTLVHGTGRRPVLTVECRQTRAVEDIYADGWFWWSWAERIAPADDPLTAAHLITAVLRATPPPAPPTAHHARKRPAEPRVDEIVLSAPAGHELCYSRQHQAEGTAAVVIVSFGQLGTTWPEALWPDAHGCSFAMCGPCWQITRQVAETARPRLVVHDTTGPPAPAVGCEGL